MLTRSPLCCDITLRLARRVGDGLIAGVPVSPPQILAAIREAHREGSSLRTPPPSQPSSTSSTPGSLIAYSGPARFHLVPGLFTSPSVAIAATTDALPIQSLAELRQRRCTVIAGRAGLGAQRWAAVAALFPESPLVEVDDERTWAQVERVLARLAPRTGEEPNPSGPADSARGSAGDGATADETASIRKLPELDVVGDAIAALFCHPGGVANSPRSLRRSVC